MTARFPSDAPSGNPLEGPQPAFSGVFSRSCLLVAVLALLAVLLGKLFFVDGTLLVPDAEPRVVTPRGALADSESTTIALFQTAAPSVVHVRTSRVSLRRDIFGPRYVEVPEGSGSGFVWDDDGHVVTNFHVVRGASGVEVRLHDDSEWPARVVGVSADFDLAVLKIEAPARRLSPVLVGTSADLRVGQSVFAIGNPFGLDQTLTTGVISGLDRAILSFGDLPIRGVIQTDAAINPGNSGGPLLDSAGRLVGVNTAIASTTGAYSGVGFAVPVDTVNRVVPRILRDGLAERAGLGVVVGSDELGREAGVEGAVIESVQPGGPAERSGLRGARVANDGSVALGDVIVGLDERVIRSGHELIEALESYRSGDVVRVRIVRSTRGDTRTEEVSVRLENLEALISPR